MTTTNTFSRDDVEVLEDKTEWKGFFELRGLRLRHRLFAGGWSREIHRELFVRGAAVGVLLYDPARDAVAMVEQFRVGALRRSESPWLLELVAGIVEEGETPEDVARREALEEADTSIKALEWVAEYYSSPGGSDEYFYLFCGCADLSEAGGIHGLADEGEDIRVSLVAASDAVAMADSGEINNAHSLIAVHWLARHRERLRGQWRGLAE